MKVETSSVRTAGLLSLFDLHTMYYVRALDGISDQDAHNRLNTEANHMAWLAGSAIYGRIQMTSETHPGQQMSGHELFQDMRGIQAQATYPTLGEYRRDWERITPLARQALIGLDDAKLDSEMDMGFMKMSYYELLVFTIYREANLIGQLALWRRLLGYPALKYDE